MHDPTSAAFGLIATAALAVLTGNGLWGWLRDRAKLRAAQRAAKAAEPADLATAYASFAKTLNDQAEAFIKALQAERANLVRRVSELGVEVERLSREHEECLGENRQLRQRIDSLERLLHLPEGSAVTFQAGGVDVSAPKEG
jgi:uncharacterized protein HemX